MQFYECKKSKFFCAFCILLAIQNSYFLTLIFSTFWKMSLLTICKYLIDLLSASYKSEFCSYILHFTFKERLNRLRLLIGLAQRYWRGLFQQIVRREHGQRVPNRWGYSRKFGYGQRWIVFLWMWRRASTENFRKDLMWVIPYSKNPTVLYPLTSAVGKRLTLWKFLRVLRYAG